jgi:hypothetical protein
VLIEWADRFPRLPLAVTHRVRIEHGEAGLRTITCASVEASAQ